VAAEEFAAWVAVMLAGLAAAESKLATASRELSTVRTSRS